MPKYKPKGCKCGPASSEAEGGCQDVCTTPVCGTPQYLTMLAPVVYDEIGINLCRQICLSKGFSSVYPSAETVTAEAVSVDFSTASGETLCITPINGRPNCYSIVLRDITVNFAVKVYDCAKRLLAILPIPAVYLPSSGSSDYAYYDEDTNPSSVELELYAPYGVSYSGGNVTYPVVHFLGFSTDNNTPAQGLNMMIIPKVLGFDPATGNVSMGLSLYLKSIYYAQYLIPHNGRAAVPKGSLIPPEDTVCMEFVSGGLLDREIKPLELGPPLYEEALKNDCGAAPCCCPPASAVPKAPAAAAAEAPVPMPPVSTGAGGEEDSPKAAPDSESLLNTLAKLGSP